MTLREARKSVRRWGKLWRLMKSRRDRLGMRFAIDRALLWRGHINRMEKL